MLKLVGWSLFMRHKCYQFVYHLITLRIIEADAVMKTVTITSCSVTITNFLSNEKCYGKWTGNTVP